MTIKIEIISCDLVEYVELLVHLFNEDDNQFPDWLFSLHPHLETSLTPTELEFIIKLQYWFILLYTYVGACVK